MVLCHSINAASVVGLPSSGGDTQTLPHAEEFELFEPTGGGGCKTLGTSACSWARALVPKSQHCGTFTTCNFFYVLDIKK